MIYPHNKLWLFHFADGETEHREARELALGHVAAEWWNQDLNPGDLDPEKLSSALLRRQEF